jgi:hypothetical protein
MAPHVVLKAHFQDSQELLALFGGQLFFELAFAHSFASRQGQDQVPSGT